jgi:hypothetical protein
MTEGKLGDAGEEVDGIKRWKRGGLEASRNRISSRRSQELPNNALTD